MRAPHLLFLRMGANSAKREDTMLVSIGVAANCNCNCNRNCNRNCNCNSNCSLHTATAICFFCQADLDRTPTFLGGAPFYTPRWHWFVAFGSLASGYSATSRDCVPGKKEADRFCSECTDASGVSMLVSERTLAKSVITS